MLDEDKYMIRGVILGVYTSTIIFALYFYSVARWNWRTPEDFAISLFVVPAMLTIGLICNRIILKRWLI